nr:hypothetical protein [Actinacidiphila oryziradicis]
MVRGFAARGDRLALIARGEEGLAGAVKEAREAGATAIPVPADTLTRRRWKTPPRRRSGSSGRSMCG